MRTLAGALALVTLLLPGLGGLAPPPSTAALLPPPVPPKTIGYGVMTLAAPDRLDRAKRMGFNWVKLIGSWKAVQPTSRETFTWQALDADIERATTRGMRILLRVDEPPAWATGTDARNAPPLDDTALADFLAAVAARYRGKIQAYEIWNEPNTSLEWGGRPPDPAKYVRMLRALYPKVKAADPNAILVTGGLATTGDAGTGREAWGDLTYLRALYENGARGFFDAIGSHPYSGPYPPETPAERAPLGVYFRRLEEQRRVAEQFGDDPAFWLTEVGWLHNFEGARCNLAAYDPYRAAWQVSEQEQADYLVRAFRYAREHWPWAGPIFIYNLDFALDPWRTRCDPNRFYSLVRGDGTPLAAWQQLAAMPRWESQPPRAKVQPLPPVLGDLWFPLRWSGFDGESGVASYDVEYRVLPEGTWQPLAANVGDLVLEVDVADRTTYQFRVQPMDWAGNRGPWAESTPLTVSLAGYLSPTQSFVSLWLTPTAGITTTVLAYNYGGSPLNWQAQAQPAWLTVSPSRGHLGPGQSLVLTVTVAANLALGVHDGAILLSSDGWRTGGPVSVRAQVLPQVERRYLPLVSLGEGAATPFQVSGPPRRVSLRPR
ncbi:MAG: cellulase family glycosylhydrolase [Chloroflexi bacterium]|nr:cellulase family glycosylhydrolase [Chloroflexota bacterium]